MAEFSSEEIKAQLDRILGSDEFKESKKLQGFLSYIVQETLKGKGNQLKQYNIAIGAFGRDETFDPNLDPIVRIQAGRLRSSLSSYYRDKGKDDPILISIPVGRYIPVFSPMATVADDVDQANGRMYQDEAIALMPFVNLSNDAGKQYLVDGFTEELLLEMARYNHLSIILSPPNGNDHDDGNNWFRDRYARFSLRGTLRMRDNRIKLVINLIDAKLSEQVWSANYEFAYKPDEVLQQQEKIAQEVANKVGDILGGVVIKRLMRESKQRVGRDVLPYDALLMFYQYLKNPVPENVKTSYTMTTEALKVDPENGINWAILGTLLLDEIAFGDANEVEYASTDALNFTRKGVEYEPDQQFTRVMYSNALFMNNRLAEAIEQGRIAYKLNPHAAFHVGLIGWILVLSGAGEEGMDLIEEGIYLNPGYPKWYHLATCIYYLEQKNYSLALEEANKLDIPGLFWDPLMKVVCMGHLGMQEEAGVQAKRLATKVPDFREKGATLIDWFVKKESNKKEIYAGLAKAGIAIG